MRILKAHEFLDISGGLDLEGKRLSDNVIDCRSDYICTNLKSGGIEWGATASRLWYMMVNYF
jgi:hypothetical protein